MQKAIQNFQARGEEISPYISNVQQVPKVTYTAIQPIVTNLRNVQSNGSDLNLEIPKLHSKEHEDGLEQDSFICQVLAESKLAVVDGQHRRKAFEMVLNWLREVDASGQYPDETFTPFRLISIWDDFE